MFLFSFFFQASNAAVQHCSFVMISGIIFMWGVLGLDTSKCPMDQPIAAKNAIFYTYTWVNASWLLIYSISLLFYPIKGKELAKVVATVERRRRMGKEDVAVEVGVVEAVEAVEGGTVETVEGGTVEMEMKE